MHIRYTGTSRTPFRARPGWFDNYDSGELIGADVVVVDEVLKSPTKLLWAGVDLLLAQDDDGDDLVCPNALLDAALPVCLSAVLRMRRDGTEAKVVLVFEDARGSQYRLQCRL